MIKRLITHWVYGGALAGVLILCLFPLMARPWSAALAWTVLMLPVYMLHQYEEHDDDRFRLFFNQTIGGGKEVLSHLAVFVINVPGVWGVIAVSAYLAADVNIGFGLIAVYLALVNAAVHIVHALIFRKYNPGLITAIVLFIPAGSAAIWEIDRAGGGRWEMQALGIAIAVGIHAAIIGYVRWRSANLNLVDPATGA